MAEEQKKRPGRPKKENTAIAAPGNLTDAAVRGSGNDVMPPEDNTLYVAHAIDALRYGPVDLYNEAQVYDRLKLYIGSCKRNGMRPTPPGLANWLGITTEELKEWLVEPGDPEHRRLATRLYEFLRASWADYALTGKTPPSIAIFVAKNWFAMSDTNKVADAPQVKTQLDLEKLAAEAAALPDSEIIEA